MVAAAVEQLELAAAHGFDGQVIQLGLGRDFEPLAARERRNFAGAAGLALEHAVGLAELVRLAKQQSREQLEIEAHLAHPLLRDGRVEIDADANGFAFGPRAHGVVELEIRIDDGIETLAIALRVRIRERHADFLRGRVGFALAGFRNRRPLPGRRLEAHVAVRGDALVVHDDAEAALVAFGVVVLPVHHVDAGPLEVFLGVEFEIVGREAAAGPERVRKARNISRRIAIPFVTAEGYLNLSREDSPLSVRRAATG